MQANDYLMSNGTRHGLSKQVIRWMAYMVLIAGAIGSFTAIIIVGKNAIQASTSVQPVSEVTPNNKVSRQAYDWGVRTCIDPISRVSDFLTEGKTYSAMSMRGNVNANEQMFSAVVAAQNQASKSESLSFMAVAPVSGNGCNSIYQTVTHFEAECQSVRGQFFSGFSKPIPFNDSVKAFSTESGGSFAYFLPVSSGACVVMKMQALF